MAPATAAASRASGTPKSALTATSSTRPRKPTLVRKRDDLSSDGPNDVFSSPVSPFKKPRVAFNNEVDVKILEQWGKSPALVRDEVRRALDRHARGDPWEYESLIELYGAGADAEHQALLKTYTAVIAGHAVALGRPYRGLVRAMLQSDWIARDDDYVALFQRFLGTLASTQGLWLADILGTLVDMFKKSPKPSNGRASLPPSQIRQRVHATLQTLLRLVPSASGVLAHVLSNAYPSAADSRRRHVVYVRNILRTTQYAPELQSEILSLITSQLIKIDVQVQIDLFELADEISDSLVRDIPRLGSLDDASDDDEAESDSDEEPDDDEDVDPTAQRAKEIISNIEKLDVILDILFAFYTRLLERPETAVCVGDTLLSQFNALILPSYRSRHTQFLIFHFAQQSLDGVDSFAGALTAVVFDASRPPLVRESAATYLASFVARGRHVPGSIVRDVFAYLGAQLAHLRAAHNGPACRGPDPRRYHTFYALMQALLYIFCFRWRDLTVAAAAASAPTLSPASTQSDDENDNGGFDDDDDDDEDPDAAPVFLRSTRTALRDNIYTKINPLRVCAPAIVAEFARIARRLRFMYVYPLLATNKRVRLATGPLPASTGGAGGGGPSALDGPALGAAARKEVDAQQLDAYFPFDPYRLPRSKRWVADDYREWVGVPGASDDEASASEGEDEGEASGDESTATESGEE